MPRGTTFLARWVATQTFRWVSIAFGLGFLYVCASTPLSAIEQILFGIVIVGFVWAISRNSSRWATIGLAVATLSAASRYLYWRVTQTLDFASPLESFLGYGMFCAELFFLTILIFSYIQSLWPFRRDPVPLPDDVSLWPTVDLMIPTYNEPLEIVRTTVLAATRLDYPADKLKIHVLDDGKRKEVEAMAAELGVNYITRSDNKHAKAGNLNNAMKYTSGELVAIFDCDHAPTRGFLQFTVGWFLKDPKMAILQTPHYFYNKDPFERNLVAGDGLPNEGLLFYGLVQEGNDFWNASFFCGSCAVLRRKAIESIGGFAVETVTEDAHTSLRIHQKGWNTGFIRVPLAAGLATESLGAHIRQRLRWARGMTQIFRMDNPFLIPGLTLAQRLCYANAMLHFLFPIPRIVLLTAPLAFLVFGKHIIVADAVQVLAYVSPYIAVAVATSLRLHRGHRYIFWTEIYETTLAFHLLWPTLKTLFKPKGGSFNVTNKGELTAQSYFNWRVLLPQIAVTGILLAAIGDGIWTLYQGSLSGDIIFTTVLNLIWAVISVLILLMAVAVGLESQELRLTPRVKAVLDGTLQLESGHTFPMQTVDVSTTGAHLKVRKPASWAGGPVYLELPCGGGTAVFKGTVIDWTDEKLRVRFEIADFASHARLVQTVLGRADAWVEWDAVATNTVRHSLRLVLSSVGYFVGWAFRRITRRPASHRPVNRAVPRLKAKKQNEGFPEMLPRTARKLARIGSAALLLGLFTITVPHARAQNDTPSTDTASATPPSPQTGEARTLTMQLKDLGIADTIRLQGGEAAYGTAFTLRSDEVVNGARMRLRIAFSPNLDPQESQFTVTLNGEAVYSMTLDPKNGTTDVVEFDISPYLFVPDNNLVFSVVDKKVGVIDRPQSSDKTVWVQISNTSEMQLNVRRFSVVPDLKNLPAPFFDRRDNTELTLPFVFSSAPTNEVVTSAAIVASFWGSLATYRSARFPVYVSDIPAGNAVVFTTDPDWAKRLGIDTVEGPTLAVVRNPRSATGQLLLVLGRNDEELKAAAKTLSVGSNLLSGKYAVVGDPKLTPRQPYDAPGWVSTTRPVSLGELAPTNQLEGRGFAPGVLGVNFKATPDLYVWRDKGLPLNVRFRFPGKEWLDLRTSRLDVLINDRFLNSFPLRESDAGVIEHTLGADFVQSEGKVLIPAYMIYGQNQLQFYFDLHPKVGDNRVTETPSQIRVAIDSDSNFDFTGAYHYARMPNLAFLAQAGFPFSRMADLSQTVVVLPNNYGDGELEALMNTMGAIGAKTAYPAVGVRVVGPAQAKSIKDADFLLIGTVDNQPLLQEWGKYAPVDLTGTTVHARTRTPFERLQSRLSTEIFGRPMYDEVTLPSSTISSALMSYQSPLEKGRTVVAMIGKTGDDLVRMSNALRSNVESPQIQGDFVVANGKEILSFSVADPYYIGHLPAFVWLQWYLSTHSWILYFAFVGGVLLLATGIFWTMRRRAARLAFSGSSLN